MDTLDGSLLRGSSRSTRQTRTSAMMPPPSQPSSRFPNEPSMIHSNQVSSPNEFTYRAGTYFPNSTMFSPNSNDTLNSSQMSNQQLSSTHIITTNKVPNMSSDESIMSYQKVKKVVTNSFSIVDAELRAKEGHLSHLKNIDMSKYSFPNETRPKTDYTYARTGSYRSSELANNQEDVMPNLCRRARRSPPFNYSTSSATNDFKSVYSFSPISFLRNAGSAGTRTVSVSLDKLNSSFNSVCSYFTSVVSNTRTRNPVNAELTSEQLVNAKALNRRLAYELNEEKGKILDEENTNRRETRSSSTLRKLAIFSHLYGLDRDSPPPSVVPSQQAPAPKKHPAGNVNIARGGNRPDANLPEPERIDARNSPARIVGESTLGTRETIEITRTTLEERPPPRPRRERGAGCFGGCLLPLILLLLLLIPIGYTFLHNNENFVNSQFYQTSAQAYHEYVEPIWLSFQNYGDRFFAWLADTFAYIYSGTKCLSDRLFGCPNRTDTSASLEELAREVKKIILKDISKEFNTVQDSDLEEMIRKSIEDKISKTFPSINEQLKNQQSEIASSKQATLQEINQLNGLLATLQTLHQGLVKKFENQGEQVKQANEAAQHAQETAEEARRLALTQADNVPKTQIDHSVLDKNVTLREIEEYINRTFYLYNADKTGKTDFASESVGGSVLFTRCTETYMEGARWFTVFDVPITRITVSPRVVIQGTIQPGNCWAFKGSKADLFIKLAARIRPTSFSIEHIPKELSITGNIDSAPQNFTIYGYKNKEEISDDKRLLLGSYRYDNNSKNPLQFFDAMHHYNVPIGVIELKIESNAGNKDYTCLYKFRVHGELFKLQNGSLENGQGEAGDKSSIVNENKPSIPNNS